MRVAAIFGPGLSPSQLKPFALLSDADWQFGLPAACGEVDAIMLFGGDGTVHRHLPRLVKLQLPILVVPHGSGNDFARALSLGSVGRAIDAWRQFVSSDGPSMKNVRRVDLGVISPLSSSGEFVSADPMAPGRYFCCVGSVGLDAKVARHANQLPRALRRRGGYLFSLLPALLRFEPVAAKLETSREKGQNGLEIRYDGPAMIVAFANTPTYGGGMRIAPHARLDDGKLEICVVGGMARARLLRLFPSVYSGRHLDLSEVEYFQAERLRIETDRPTDVYADGEYVCSTPVEVAVQIAALKVIVPAGLAH